MSTPGISPAKVILLAVKAAAAADVATLRTLVVTCSKTLNPIFLRILLTYLPESLESSEYVQLIVDYQSGVPSNTPLPPLDTSRLGDISEAQAAQEVRKLRLLKLRMVEKCADAPDSDLVLFLLHRAYRIDQETGLITELPELLAPFLDQSDYLRRWMLGTVLPLLRLNYEYHPSPNGVQSLDWFENLDTSNAVKYLLSRTLHPEGALVGRNLNIVPDVRGLTGPWLYGQNQWKRRKTSESEMAAQTIEPLSAPTAKTPRRYGDWDTLFAWILRQTPAHHSAVAELLGQWHDARDVDLGGYGASEALLSEEDAEHINAHYAHCTVSSAFRVQEPTLPALSDAHRILTKASERVGSGLIPTLQASAALLAPVFEFTEEDRSIKEQVKDLIVYLRNDDCHFSKPTHHTVHFVHALLTSTYLLLRSTNTPPTIEQTAQLLVLDDPVRQITLLKEFLDNTTASGGDDKLWLRRRNEILWLHDWGLQPHLDSAAESANHKGRGPFGLIPLTELHIRFLHRLLSTSPKAPKKAGRAMFVNQTDALLTVPAPDYSLASSQYEATPKPPLPDDILKSTVTDAADDFMSQANNPNKTQGGIRKALDILEAFPKTLRDHVPAKRLEHIAEASHVMRSYRLILNNNEPWKPSILMSHLDPLAIVQSVLAQNTRTYHKIDQFLYFGEQVVRGGLTVRDKHGKIQLEDGEKTQEQLEIAKWRITAMCIDAALAEDDFETAYSMVTTRLPEYGGDALTQMDNFEPSKKSVPSTPMHEPGSAVFEALKSGSVARPPMKAKDNWSWRAAFQAGKYRLNEYTIKPTHVGNSSANPAIRHLEQRMECLGQALRIAPPAALQEILNVFRRCEEELDTKIREEAEQEAKWDEKADEEAIPGGFMEHRDMGLAREKAETGTAKARMGEGAPMSLFDLTRASAAQAQKSLAALTASTGVIPKRSMEGSRESRNSMAGSEVSQGSAVNQSTVRKRDQLRSAAVGTLAGGIGWLIGAPAPQPHPDDEYTTRD